MRVRVSRSVFIGCYDTDFEFNIVESPRGSATLEFSEFSHEDFVYTDNAPYPLVNSYLEFDTVIPPNSDERLNTLSTNHVASETAYNLAHAFPTDVRGPHVFTASHSQTQWTIPPVFGFNPGDICRDVDNFVLSPATWDNSSISLESDELSDAVKKLSSDGQQKGRRRGPLDPKTRKKASMVRQSGACWQCRLNKTEVILDIWRCSQ
jgi:hypothetical protein